MTAKEIDIYLTSDVTHSNEKTYLKKKNIVGMSRTELNTALLTIEPQAKNFKMRENQIWNWVYQKGVKDFDLMTNISKEYREALKKSFVIERHRIIKKQISTDGTRKYLLSLQDGNQIEAVYIPERDRGTLCISSP